MASARDMEEFLGEWHREDETVEFYITVDADQSVPNMMALSGMQEAEGAITATGSDFEEQLTYILDPTTLEQGNFLRSYLVWCLKTWMFLLL